MSLRFTETNKWKDDWYLSLTNDYRIIWQYLLDNCSISGMWQKGFKHLNYFCGTNITEPEFQKIFEGRCFELKNSNFIFIPKFIKVQYPKGLSPKKPLTNSVIKEIEIFNLSTIIKESIPNYYAIIECSLNNEQGKGKGKGNRKMEEGNRKQEKGNNGEISKPELKEESLHVRFRQIFLENYKRKKDSDFTWGVHAAKHGKNLNGIIDQTRIKVGAKVANPSDDELCEFWTVFLDHLPDWEFKNNFSPTGINSRFNEIFDKINNFKNGTNNANSDRQVDEILKRGNPYA